MKTLIIISILLLSVSCMTVKRVERNCDLFMTVCEVPVKVETEILTNTITKIEYRDTTIYVYLPGKVIERKVPVYITKGIVNSDLSVLVTPLARSTARVFNSELEHDLIQTDTTLQLEVQNALKTIKIQEKQIETLREKYVVKVTKNTKFASFTIRVFWGLIVVVVLGIGFLFFKYKSKVLGI